MALEREIKLRFDTAAEARARIAALDVQPLRARRLQADSLLDTHDQSLRERRSALRVRRDDGRTLLTFKGPVQPGAMKLRDEQETAVADEAVLLTILRALGYEVWFRYEKYREEYAADGAVIALDDTPVGVFVEIEGDEARVALLARALGREPADYITDSYHALFVKDRDQRGHERRHMLFSPRDDE